MTHNRFMNSVYLGSSSLAAYLQSFGFGCDLWSLFASGEVFAGSAFVYVVFVMAASSVTFVWDYQDREIRRVVQESVSFGNAGYSKASARVA